MRMYQRSNSGEARRFEWDEMRRFWEKHYELRAPADPDSDPEALDNVCTPGAPGWLNRHYARGQEAIFECLLDRVPADRGRALDVGCGAARWSRRLSERGWEVTGIDLQERLIAHNRRLLPNIRFERVALQDFESDARFSLVSSVTVLGHIPHRDQPAAIEKLHSLTGAGGRILILENVRDQSAHVFANSIEGWVAQFRAAGFACEAVVPYDFNPCLRAVSGARRVVGRIARRHRLPAATSPDEFMATALEDRASAPRRASEHVFQELLTFAGAIDRHLDPWLTQRAATVPAPVHAGMLFARA